MQMVKRSSQRQNDMVSLLPYLWFVQTALITCQACSELIAQFVLVRINHDCTYHPFYSPKSSKIFRCWVVWHKNTRVVIIPLFLAITSIGQ